MFKIMIFAVSLQWVDGLKILLEEAQNDDPCEQQQVAGEWKHQPGYGVQMREAHAKRIVRDKHNLCDGRICDGSNYSCSEEQLNWFFESNSLESFSPEEFLVRLSGKTLSFWGDSLSYQHFNQLICMLHTDTTYEVEEVERPCGHASLDELSAKGACVHNGFTRIKFANGAVIQYQDTNLEPTTITRKICKNVEKTDQRIYKADFMVYNEGAHQHSWDALQSRLESQLRDIRQNFRGLLIFRDYSPVHFPQGDYHVDQRRRKNAKCSDNVQPNNVDEFRSSYARRYMINAGARPLCTHNLTLSAPASLHHDGGSKTDCRHWCTPSPVIDMWNRMLAKILRAQ